MPNSAGNAGGPAILLVDNGSLVPAATLALRAIAEKLSAALGQPVAPVSLLHSSAICPEALEGKPAEILEPALERRLHQGANEFLLVPLFFGPSNALNEYLPRRIGGIKMKFPALCVRLAPPLVDLRDASDDRMAAILEDRVRSVLDGLPGQPSVLVVDHGSPVRAVTAVRDHLAAQLQGRLGNAVRTVQAASMERRPGPHYTFSEPLLERILDEPGFDAGIVVIAMLFLSPGRHAGPAGDVIQIVSAAQKRHPLLRPIFTELIGSHPGLIPILVDRARAGLASPPM